MHLSYLVDCEQLKYRDHHCVFMALHDIQGVLGAQQTCDDRTSEHVCVGRSHTESLVNLEW